MLFRSIVTLPVKPKEPVSRLVSIDSGIGLEFDDECDKRADPKVEVPPEEPMHELSLPPYNCHIYEGNVNTQMLFSWS